MGYVLWAEKLWLWCWAQIRTVSLRAFCSPPAQGCVLPSLVTAQSPAFSLFQKLHLSEDVAGATFMAAGSSTPELFASVIGKDVDKGSRDTVQREAGLTAQASGAFTSSMPRFPHL